MEIRPCVLQDIGPLGPLPKKAVEQDSDIHFDLTWAKKNLKHIFVPKTAIFHWEMV